MLPTLNSYENWCSSVLFGLDILSFWVHCHFMFCFSTFFHFFSTETLPKGQFLKCNDNNIRNGQYYIFYFLKNGTYKTTQNAAALG